MGHRRRGLISASGLPSPRASRGLQAGGRAIGVEIRRPLYFFIRQRDFETRMALRVMCPFSLLEREPGVTRVFYGGTKLTLHSFLCSFSLMDELPSVSVFTLFLCGRPYRVICTRFRSCGVGEIHIKKKTKGSGEWEQLSAFILYSSE